uniref:Uncharacterized protein n=1 Tax=Anguilla anguilla TaxID=7936 RepID=A0A0E9SE69_ANGAN
MASTPSASALSAVLRCRETYLLETRRGLLPAADTA